MKILSVNISKETGTIKKPVSEIRLDKYGIQEDAHAGNWHRQVSLLGKESVDRFSALAGRKIAFGEFAENLTTEGLELVNTSPLDRLIGKEVELEITQIGKECHGSSCAIFREVGNCVMPKEGIFARVIRPGILRPGDELEYVPKVLRFQLITLSDRASRGEYEDRSGPRIAALLEKHFENLPRNIQIESRIIADDALALEKMINESVQEGVDTVITTGGTGVGPRDITVETIRPKLDKEVPGIMELIRVKYGGQKPNALLSCGVAGFIKNTMVYTLPGSVKAVNEYMEEILKTLEHLIYMRYGLDVH
ncbi:MAG: molybdenum cofactor synthesis domain-containing protein [Bacteroides sp.]|jgi:molybdenum cofactor synthesis domain-containing protein|nr:molybdenum cofactor synthesis domain-containing protein [Bacteroides sp.]